MQDSDSKLVQDYLGGEEAALKTLVGRHLSLVYNFTYRISGSKEEANDITQETFVKVWKNLKKYDSDKKFTTWLLAIARNSALDFLKKKRPKNFSSFETDEDETPFEETLADDKLLQHELFEEKESQERVEKLLATLPLPQRDVIVLHIYQELSFQEISEILGKPLNTIKSIYRRGLITLKKNIELHQNGSSDRIS